MRSSILYAAVLSMLAPASWLSAQTIPGPTLAPPPPAPAAPNTDAPSEIWHPPAGAASAPPTVSPESELPIPGATPDPAAEASTKVIVEEPPSTWSAPVFWLGPAPWDSGIELGINGSSGTSDSLSMRTGAYIKRESRFSKLDFNTDYNLTMSDGKASQSNAQLDITNDWLIDEDSPWTLFLKNDVFYDKFAAFNIESNTNLGVGYRFVHTPELELMTRLGSGVSRQFGGPDDHWVPESLLGFEYGQKVSKTQKFYGKLDYYPEWDEVGEFRMVADTGWEIELVQPSNLSLKISATDRYDSTPDGVNPHLLNYSVLLLLKL